MAKTPDLPALMTFLAAASVLAMMGGTWCRNIAQSLVPYLANAGTISISGGGAVQIGRHALLVAAPVTIVVLLSASFAGVAGHLVQTGLIFTPSKVLKMDFSK